LTRVRLLWRIGIEVIPTGGPLGAEVSGVDLSCDPAPETIGEIVAALARHLVLIFRSQVLRKERLIGIADWFGGCHRTTSDEPALGDGTHDPIVIVSNVHERGVLGSGFVAHHSDQEFLGEPARATLRYAVETPPSGGETSWSNLCQAYDELSERAKRRVERLERWSLNPYAGGGHAIRAVAGTNQRYTDRPAPIHVHPLVRTHPVTGRKALYVSSLTSGIRGVRGPFAARRARGLLARLNRHVDRDHLYYTHAWRPGDLVIWDNLFTNHKRAAFDPSERRLMHRSQVVGSPPDPSVPDAPSWRLWRPDAN